MAVLGDLVAAEGSAGADRSYGLKVPGDPETRYTAEQFARLARQTGNFLARYGLGAHRPLGLADDTATAPILGLYAAALLGAPIIVEPPSADDVACLLGPMDWIETIDVPPGTEPVGYGGQGDDPSITSFEATVPRENPGFPPMAVDPSTPLIETEGQTFSHETVLESARRVRSDHSLEPGDRVCLGTSLAEPGMIIAGLVAPVVSGATIVLTDKRADGDVIITREKAIDGQHIDPRQYHPEA